MDLFPTASALAGVAMPTDRPYDGKDMTDVILNRNGGKSKHVVLFFYGGASPDGGGPGAARMGPWKAYWATGPGLGGCKWATCVKRQYPTNAPLLFNVNIDPSEGQPLANGNSTIAVSRRPLLIAPRPRPRRTDRMSALIARCPALSPWCEHRVL